MRFIRYIILPLVAGVACFLTYSCDDSKSYAELLTEEDHYVNNFLANQVVILEVPADTVFEVGENAPYYRLDEDGELYMQVLNAGTPGNRVESNEQIYFRYTAWPLSLYDGELHEGSGNNLTLSPCWFRYNNFQMQASYQWGVGIQRPLAYLPVDCHVRLVIKSQMGIVDNMSLVQPYLYELTYMRRQ